MEIYEDGVGIARCTTCHLRVHQADVDALRAQFGPDVLVHRCQCPANAGVTKGSDTAMAKSSRKPTTQKPTTATAHRKGVTHRLHTHKPNGAPSETREVAPAPIPIGEAMRRAVEALGEVVVDDALAGNQLRELADAYEHVTAEQAAFDEKAEAAKVAKKAVESATNLLLEKVRAFTHAAPLPLFDATHAEHDLATMVAGGDVTEDAVAE